MPTPSLYAYAVADGCATCKAKPGVPCHPAAATGIPADPLVRLHPCRLAAGRRHRDLGLGLAPEERLNRLIREGA